MTEPTAQPRPEPASSTPVMVEVTDWWCPAEQRWTMCPGCQPDCDHSRTRTSLARRISPAELQDRLRASRAATELGAPETRDV